MQKNAVLGHRKGQFTRKAKRRYKKGKHQTQQKRTVAAKASTVQTATGSGKRTVELTSNRRNCRRTMWSACAGFGAGLGSSTLIRGDRWSGTPLLGSGALFSVDLLPSTCSCPSRANIFRASSAFVSIFRKATKRVESWNNVACGNPFRPQT